MKGYEALEHNSEKRNREMNHVGKHKVRRVLDAKDIQLGLRLKAITEGN